MAGEGEIMRLLVDDTEDIRSSSEGSGGLGMDMLELDERLAGVGLVVMTGKAPRYSAFGISHTTHHKAHTLTYKADARLHTPTQPWSVHTILTSFCPCSYNELGTFSSSHPCQGTRKGIHF